eukprot:SAG11_NODE_1458_length_4874_cov_218.142827_4_plen_119_part_00
MNILDLDHDIIEIIKNNILKIKEKKRMEHLNEIKNYDIYHSKSFLCNGKRYVFRDDDPYEHFIYNGRRYETWRKRYGCDLYDTTNWDNDYVCTDMGYVRSLENQYNHIDTNSSASDDY